MTLRNQQKQLLSHIDPAPSDAPRPPLHLRYTKDTLDLSERRVVYGTEPAVFVVSVEAVCAAQPDRGGADDAVLLAPGHAIPRQDEVTSYP